MSDAGVTAVHGPALLFCPGDRPDRYPKAYAAADTAIIDLEDAVDPEGKAAAREEIARAASGLDPARTVIRVNAVGTPWFEDDVAALADTPLRTVMLPKAAGPADLARLPGFSVIALCESATGVLAAPELARAANCAALMWGGEDLIADLGGRSSRGPDGAYREVVRHARSTVLLAATAAGKRAIDTVFLDIRDLAGVAAEAADAAASGFAAKACIHPSHADPIRRAFAPTEEEVAWAREVLAAAKEHGGVFRHRGQMVDAPVLAHARAVLAAAK